MKQKENNQVPAVINFDYEGNPIGFTMDETVTVNATEMAKPFGKQTNDWLRLTSTEEFLNTLENIRFSNEPTGKSRRSELVKTVNGIGTWMHEDVALEFARWLSPKFGIWCNDRIKELLTKGQTSLNPHHPEISNFMRHSDRKLPYEYENHPNVNPTVRHLQQILCQSPDIMSSLRAYCQKKHYSMRAVIAAAIEEKLYREAYPDKFNQVKLMDEIEMKKQEIYYLNCLFAEKEKSCHEKFDIELAMKNQEIDYLKQLQAAKDQTIAVLQDNK
jgi:hypothetical protein